MGGSGSRDAGDAFSRAGKQKGKHVSESQDFYIPRVTNQLLLVVIVLERVRDTTWFRSAKKRKQWYHAEKSSLAEPCRKSGLERASEKPSRPGVTHCHTLGSSGNSE